MPGVVVVLFVEKLWVVCYTEVPVQLSGLYKEDLVAGSTIFVQLARQSLSMLTRPPTQLAP